MIGILARESQDTFLGRVEKTIPDLGSDLSSVRGGSRQNASESYILGTQPRVQKDIIKEVGRPPDVKSRTVQSSRRWGVGGLTNHDDTISTGRSEECRTEYVGERVCRVCVCVCVCVQVSPSSPRDTVTT